MKQDRFLIGILIFIVILVAVALDPFSSPWSDTQNASLVKQGGVWKLTSMPNPYWGWDWYTPTPYPTKTP